MQLITVPGSVYDDSKFIAAITHYEEAVEGVVKTVLKPCRYRCSQGSHGRRRFRRPEILPRTQPSCQYRSQSRSVEDSSRTEETSYATGSDQPSLDDRYAMAETIWKIDSRASRSRWDRRSSSNTKDELKVVLFHASGHWTVIRNREIL